MKFNLVSGSSEQHIYEVNADKYIRVDFTRETHEIKDIILAKIERFPDREYRVYSEFIPEGLLYLENVCHGEDNEVLDTNLLMIVEEHFREVC